MIINRIKRIHKIHKIRIHSYIVLVLIRFISDIIAGFHVNIYLFTASAHLTFSLARPPTNLLANWIVALVASASRWHSSFSVVAFSKSAVSLASCSSRDLKKK